jgi:uncharacterized protein
VRRIAVLLLWIAACSRQPREDSAPPPPVGSSQVAAPAPAGPDTRPTVTLSGATGDTVVHVEIVSTPAAVQRGLMFRQNLPPDDGMLFLMKTDYDWTFWMHNTLIPLDLIFITADLKIAGIVENAEPENDKLRSVGAPSRYVLEVNAGWSAKHKVAAGAKVAFAGVPAS